MTTPEFYINTYHVTRHYGGPEEGGWWFDRGEPAGSLGPCNSPTLAHKVAELLRAYEWSNGATTDERYSMAPRTAYDTLVMVEEHPAKQFPEEYPRYE